MTRVAILWHMHQPFYEDLVTREHVLPWVRLHALKDYWGMVALLREFPGVRMTFNLVPSLLVQLEAFARNEARDRHLELGLKRAEDLTEEERAFCIAEFFHAHRPRMIDPYPRYRELLERRGDGLGGLSARVLAAQYSADDFRDLQVWHKLVWIDPIYHDDDARIRSLVAKGRGYSEEDKQVLREVELELLRKVIPEYAAAAARGQIELSASPFYHPILPLLCDTDVHLRAHPHSRMPRQPFRRPEDAAEQLRRAGAQHERLFGHRPVGLWPSEGSVSDAMVPLAVKAGFRWMATDEDILARTIGAPFTRSADGHVEQPLRLYQPYMVGRGTEAIACAFRDHALSDMIGFRYGGWSAEGAATDFVQRLVEAGRRYTAQGGKGEASVFVILDGENAWEYYEGQGRPFLRALYGALASSPDLATVTMSAACARPRETLASIFPGSWINGDFYIWIGHPDDHRAWSQLADARRLLDDPPPGLPADALARAREEMLIAEGSDWFWWYGDDHSSSHDLEFDDLFRRHVRNVYRALERPVPEELFVTNITTQPPAVDIEAPTGFIEPLVDGEVTSYFEWIGAGSLAAGGAAGTMHQVSPDEGAVVCVLFGFDERRLFVRVDGTRPMRDLFASGVELRLNFLTPPGLQVVSRVDDGTVRVELVGGTSAGARHGRPCDGLAGAVATVAEFSVPFACLGVVRHDPVAFQVALYRERAEVGRYPRGRAIEFDVPDRGFLARNWRV